jgi:cell division protein FtsZ
MMGSGFASGDSRAIEAAERAISSPLLEDIDIHGAQGILVNVTGNEDMTLAEYDEAVSIIHNMADEDANIICGMVYDQDADDSIRVTVVATGLSGEAALSLASVDREPVSTPRMPTLKPVVAAEVQNFQTKQPSTRTGQQQMQPQAFDQPGFNDDEYAVPTFLRRQAD